MSYQKETKGINNNYFTLPVFSGSTSGVPTRYRDGTSIHESTCDERVDMSDNRLPMEATKRPRTQRAGEFLSSENDDEQHGAGCHGTAITRPNHQVENEIMTVFRFIELGTTAGLSVWGFFLFSPCPIWALQAWRWGI